MVLTTEQQQSIAEWAEQTDGLLEVWLLRPPSQGRFTNRWDR